MSIHRDTLAFAAAIVLCASVASTEAFAAQPAVNLGGTSFMDGFGDVTGGGLSYLNYLSWAPSNSIKDAKGNDRPEFQNPRFTAIVDLHQFIYTFKMPDSAFAQPGLNLIVPLVSLDATMKNPYFTLEDNGFGVGDITLGVFAQFKPLMMEGHPIFSHRLEFNVLAPTGKYDSMKAFNPGRNHWSVNPCWAATFFPAPRVEISTRFNYLYNYVNHDPGQGLNSTKSGQAIFDNFAVAYEILPFDDTRSGALNLRAGLNGYFFKQLTQNKANGRDEADSLEQVVGLGPGAMWVPTHEDAFWLNVYFETAVQNRFASKVFQVRWAHSFAEF